MIAHEPHDQFCVALIEVVLAAELLGIDRSELGVVAAATLADVVVQGANVQQ